MDCRALENSDHQVARKILDDLGLRITPPTIVNFGTNVLVLLGPLLIIVVQVLESLTFKETKEKV